VVFFIWIIESQRKAKTVVKLTSNLIKKKLMSGMYIHTIV
jgi:hypothetical protein